MVRRFLKIKCYTTANALNPAAVSKDDSILMAQYLALSGLVGAYFALGNKGGKS